MWYNDNITKEKQMLLRDLTQLSSGRSFINKYGKVVENTPFKNAEFCPSCNCETCSMIRKQYPYTIYKDKWTTIVIDNKTSNITLEVENGKTIIGHVENIITERN
jgi:hypothetical protein